MAKPPELREIIPSQFKEEEQELIGKISEPYNDLVKQTISALNKNLNFSDNIDSQIAVHQHIGGSTSTFNYSRRNPPKGLWIVDIKNLTTPTQILSAAPFAQWGINSNNKITLNNVTGLTSGDKYEITFLIITG